MALPEIITVDGKEYVTEKMSDSAKQLLMLYSQWEKDVADSRIILAKNEAALRDLTREIKSVLTAEFPDTVKQE